MTSKQTKQNNNKNQGLKTQSLRELMSVKKNERNLPENFFEKVIEEELSLKRHFTIDKLQSLVDLYSVNNL